MWVPKFLKDKGASSQRKFWNFPAMRDPNAFCRDWSPRTKAVYITMTRKKATNNGVAGIASRPPKKFRVQKSAGKVLASLDFWN